MWSPKFEDLRNQKVEGPEKAVLLNNWAYKKPLCIASFELKFHSETTGSFLAKRFIMALYYCSDKLVFIDCLFPMENLLLKLFPSGLSSRSHTSKVEFV